MLISSMNVNCYTIITFMNKDIIRISKIGLAELEALKNLSRKTFYESFSEANTEENMKQYMDNFFSDEKLTAELLDPGAAFYFARLNDDIVGYLKINSGKAQTELKDNNGLEIERIYVKGSFQGKNIGQLLFDKALEVARERHADYLWLGVWEKNPGAIKFYERNGLVKFASHLFTLGDDVQTDIMMKLDLKK